MHGVVNDFVEWVQKTSPHIYYNGMAVYPQGNWVAFPKNTGLESANDWLEPHKKIASALLPEVIISALKTMGKNISGLVFYNAQRKIGEAEMKRLATQENVDFVVQFCWKPSSEPLADFDTMVREKRLPTPKNGQSRIEFEGPVRITGVSKVLDDNAAKKAIFIAIAAKQNGQGMGKPNVQKKTPAHLQIA